MIIRFIYYAGGSFLAVLARPFNFIPKHLRNTSILFFFSGSSGYQRSTRSFIFSLHNYYGNGHFKNDINNNYNYATYSSYNYGPTFGSGHDICVASYANSNYNSYFNCHDYTSPYCNSNLWTGNNNFCPSEVEVYYEALAYV